MHAGLAGLLLVSDDEERALGLPSGALDLPIVIQDRSFDDHNQLIYLSGNPTRPPHNEAPNDRGAGMVRGVGRGGMRSMMARMMGQLGDHVLVNGRLGSVAVVERPPTDCACSTRATHAPSSSAGTTTRR